MKRAHLASGAGSMTGLNYYKASYHNYVIFTPSKEDLQQAGFGGSIYSFHAGRDKVEPQQSRREGKVEALGARKVQGGEGPMGQNRLFPG